MSLDISRERPKLDFDEQINYLKEKGIKFEQMTEDDAKQFLMNNNYLFKLKSYGKNFTRIDVPDKKYKQYVNLDFAYLVDLSTIDMYLREHILRLTTNIEHYLKVQLLKDVSFNAKTDGYDVVETFLSEIRPDLREEISNKSRNSYCRDLIRHRNGKYAIWDLVEVISFGDFVDFYSYYYSIFPSKNKIQYTLKSVQWLRNAAAHNNCIINHLGSDYSIDNPNRMVCNFIFNKIPSISTNVREKKMKNQRVHDFVVTLYVFNKIVSSEKVKYHIMKDLKELFDLRMVKHKDYYQDNLLIVSTYEFLKKVIDYLFDMCHNI